MYTGFHRLGTDRGRIPVKRMVAVCRVGIPMRRHPARLARLASRRNVSYRSASIKGLDPELGIQRESGLAAERSVLCRQDWPILDTSLF